MLLVDCRYAPVLVCTLSQLTKVAVRTKRFYFYGTIESRLLPKPTTLGNKIHCVADTVNFLADTVDFVASACVRSQSNTVDFDNFQQSRPC